MAYIIEFLYAKAASYTDSTPSHSCHGPFLFQNHNFSLPLFHQITCKHILFNPSSIQEVKKRALFVVDFCWDMHVKTSRLWLFVIGMSLGCCGLRYWETRENLERKRRSKEFLDEECNELNSDFHPDLYKFTTLNNLFLIYHLIYLLGVLKNLERDY